jgi:hypothetical protein
MMILIIDQLIALGTRVGLWPVLLMCNP